MRMVAALCALVMLVGCNDEGASTEPVKLQQPPQAQQEQAKDLVERESEMSQPKLTLVVPSMNWPRTEPLPVDLKVLNPTDVPMDLTLRSGMSADLILSQGKRVVWQFSHERMFTQALRPWSLAAGEEKTLTFTIRSEVLTALEPGRYTLQAQLNTMERPRSKPIPIVLD